MRFVVLCTFALLACVTKQFNPKERIIGSWLYDKAESLGDYSQNDNTSKAEFDKSMEGKVLIFSNNGTYKSVLRLNGEEAPIQEGNYSIEADGKFMAMDNAQPIKIFVNDTALKIYSPNNAILVWRKIK